MSASETAELDPEALFREHSVPLFRYVLRLTGGDDATARDAVQHAFLRLLERPPRQAIHPKAWLYRVAINAVRDWSAEARRRRELMAERRDHVPAPAPSPDPGESLDRTRTVRRVQEALDRLPERERAILLLREEGFKHREIAEAVGTTTGSVGTMIARALERLTGLLDLDAGDV